MDLFTAFMHHRQMLKLQLTQHTDLGGRVSLTTNAWSARNYSDYAAITMHWIDIDWEMHSCILDVVHLSEPGHTGEYLGAKSVEATNEFNLTPAICAVTRDNVSPNNKMLERLEKAANEPYVVPVHQPWPFKYEAGDVRCMAHIINLAVQSALKSLKAAPEVCCVKYPSVIGRDALVTGSTPVVSCSSAPVIRTRTLAINSYPLRMHS